MRQKAEIFFDAITALGAELVEEAQDYVFQKRRTSWRRYAGLAACLVLAAFLGYAGLFRLGAGGSDYNSSDSAAPADDAPMAPADGGVSTDTAPRPGVYGDGPELGGTPAGEPDAPAGGAEVRVFTAQVVEVRDGWLLAEVLPGGGLEAGLVEISTEGVDQLPEPGRQIEVTFAGEVQAGEVPRITEVASLLPVE